jgi:hypothetical protein
MDGWMDGNKRTIVKIYKHIFSKKQIYKHMYVPSNSVVLGSSDTPAAHYFPARIS